MEYRWVTNTTKASKTVVIKKTSKQFNIVKSQINRDDVGKIVIATDAGREGELVQDGYYKSVIQISH